MSLVGFAPGQSCAVSPLYSPCPGWDGRFGKLAIKHHYSQKNGGKRKKKV